MMGLIWGGQAVTHAVACLDKISRPTTFTFSVTQRNAPTDAVEVSHNWTAGVTRNTKQSSAHHWVFLLPSKPSSSSQKEAIYSICPNPENTNDTFSHNFPLSQILSTAQCHPPICKQFGFIFFLYAITQKSVHLTPV